MTKVNPIDFMESSQVFSFVSLKMKEVIEQRFADWSEQKRNLALCEFVKFAHLTSQIENL